MTIRAAFNSEAAARLNASWEIRTPDFTLHAVITDGRLEAGVGPAPTSPTSPSPSTRTVWPPFRALMQAAKCGLVEFDGQRTLLNTFVSVFTPQSVKPERPLNL